LSAARAIFIAGLALGAPRRLIAGFALGAPRRLITVLSLGAGRVDAGCTN
jgi:hypothetical protein